MWYIAQVEGEEPEEETAGFTLLKYMNRVGHNQFTWGERIDRLKTLNTDIIMLVEGGPVPVSSRCMGLDKKGLKTIEQLLRVLWSIISDFYLLIFIFQFLIFLLFLHLNQDPDSKSGSQTRLNLDPTGSLVQNTEKIKVFSL